jgi:hypothetical protein
VVQLAITKRTLLQVFQADEQTSLLSRYEHAAKESSLLNEPSARRDYMLMLSELSAQLDLPHEVTLGHLFEAEKCVTLRPFGLPDLYVRIAGFAEACGKNGIAIAYYQKFLDQSPRDTRRYFVQEKQTRLIQLGKGKS